VLEALDHHNLSETMPAGTDSLQTLVPSDSDLGVTYLQIKDGVTLD